MWNAGDASRPARERAAFRHGAERVALRLEEPADPAFGEVQQPVELRAVEGLALGRALDFDERRRRPSSRRSCRPRRGCLRRTADRAPGVPSTIPTETAAIWPVSGHVAASAGSTMLAQGERERDPGAGDRRGARPAVGADHVAVDGDHALAELRHVDGRAQRAPDQPLDLVRAPADLAARSLRAACARRSRAAACCTRR